MTIIIIICALYLFISIILSFAAKSYPLMLSDEFQVSLIIPAKNEALQLHRLFNSLEELDYPREKLEIVLIDHRSTDNTRPLMEEFARNSQFKVKVLNFDNIPYRDIGKAEALIFGVKEATGEIYALLDADCRFEKDWLKAIAGQLNKFDLVGGSVVMEGNSLFARLQKWDWLYLCVVGSGFAGLKIPQSLFGKNMIVTRRLYNQIGGFTPKKVWTEDLDLVQKSAGKARVTLNLSPATAVYSLPADTLKEFFRQRLRWLKGGIRVNLPGFAVMFIALLMDFAFIVSIFCNFQLWLVVFLFKLFSDIIILYRAMNKYKLNNDMIYLPIFSIFSILYQLILISIYPFNMNLKWK